MTDRPNVEFTRSQTYRHALGENAPFFAALADGRLVGRRCPTCRNVFVPPRTICPTDRVETSWVDVAGTGTVVATSHLATRPAYAAAGGPELTLGLVQLDGVETAILAELLDDEVVVGARVRAEFRAETWHPAQCLAFRLMA